MSGESPDCEIFYVEKTRKTAQPVEEQSQVVIISIDTYVDTETEEELRTYKATEGYEWIFCMDTKDIGEDDYGTSSYPTLFIINKEGKIAYDNVGETPYSTLSSEIDKLL